MERSFRSSVATTAPDPDWYGNRHEPARDYVDVPPLFPRQNESPVLCSEIARGTTELLVEPWWPSKEEAVAIVGRYPSVVREWFLYPESVGESGGVIAITRQVNESSADFAWRILVVAIGQWVSWVDDSLSDAIAEVH